MLNKCMKQDKYEYAHYWLKKKGNANYWLKKNGIAPENLLELDIGLLQAQRIATKLLKDHAKQMTKDQCDLLNSFLKAMVNKRLRKRLTRNICYRVMNIGTEVNRKSYKQRRHSKAH